MPLRPHSADPQAPRAVLTARRLARGVTVAACVALAALGCGRNAGLSEPGGDSGAGPPHGGSGPDDALYVGATALVLAPGEVSPIDAVLRDGAATREWRAAGGGNWPATEAPPTWASAAAAVAAVDQTGRVTARASGRAVVRAARGQYVDTATVVVRTAATPDRGAQVLALDAGEASTCAVTRAQGVTCWGSNWEGELGGGTARRYTATLSPTPVVGVPAAAAAVSVGGGHACALTPADGAVYCWGRNQNGQLGDGTTTSRPRAARVRGPHRFTALTTGADHACALAAEIAYCWGYSAAGQGGVRGGPPLTEPTPLPGPQRFRSVTAGAAHTCGLAADGVAYCWGANDAGQLGRSTPEAASAEPAPVAGSFRFQVLSAGRNHTCGITLAGAAYCWGDDTQAALGSGNWGGARATPTPVATTARFVAVSAGGEHTCALGESGAAMCWGANVWGQLGNAEPRLGQPATPGRPEPYYQPAPVGVAADGAAFTALVAGGAHTCAVARDGAAHCWGRNALGQLGTGRWEYLEGVPTPLRAVPTPVRSAEP